ncbi:MAG: cytochrome c [Acidobacteria bacterium]|nr:cytochrome c [Acidobacteriota bacterium]
MVLGLVGCRQDMHDAPRYDPLEASTILPGGAASQPLVDGTVARGQENADELLTTGKVGGVEADMFPFPITRTDLDLGQQRFNTYCSPCHAPSGEGDGMVVQRGYRQPPSLHIDRLRQAPAGQFYDRITNGFGVMPNYRAQISVDDRWRIVAYVRVLQAAHQGTRSDVPVAEMERLDNPQPPAADAAAASEGTN